MTPIPPAVLAVLRDRRLRRRTAHVYALLYLELTDAEFRPVKVSWVAHAARISPDNAYREISCLCRCGHVLRGPRLPGNGTRTYRLPMP